MIKHKEKMARKKVQRKASTWASQALGEPVEFKDVEILKSARMRLGDHSGYTGAELRAIRAEKGCGRPVVSNG